MLIEYIKVFAVGGVLCAIGQILIDKTKLTPARILTVYVVAGLILEAVGLYSPLVKWAGAGRDRSAYGLWQHACQGR